MVARPSGSGRERARQTIEDAAAHRTIRYRCPFALIWAVSVFLWTGDLESAEEHLDWFISRAESHSLGPYLAVGRGYKGELAIRRGDAKGGVRACRDAWRNSTQRVTSC